MLPLGAPVLWAAGAEADHQGDHAKELKDEDFMKGMLWKVLKRTSAIEMDIRMHDEGVPITAESITAAAEAVAAARPGGLRPST